MRINKTLWIGSIVLLICFGIYNFLNFIFQLIMVRMLSVSDYGILAALFSVTYVLSIFTETVQTVVTKYSSVENNLGKLKNILKKSLKKSFFIAVYLFAAYLIIAIPLSRLLKISYPLFALTGILIFSAFVLPVTRGVMQGKKRFKSLGISVISESLVKIIFAVAFVFIGWGVYGAVGGIIMGVTASFIVSFVPLRDILKQKEKKAKTIGIYNYTKPTLIISSLVIVFYSLDIIIAKILFSSEVAGAYAVASILSKVIFWGTQPISRAMFPLSTENNSNKNKSRNLFINAFSILMMCVVVALIVFYFFPKLIIYIFSGKVLDQSASILFYLGIATSFLSITNLILLYRLSINKSAKLHYLLPFIIIEILLLFIFSADMIQFSIAFMIASGLLLIGSVLLSK